MDLMPGGNPGKVLLSQDWLTDAVQGGTHQSAHRSALVAIKGGVDGD